MRELTLVDKLPYSCSDCIFSNISDFTCSKLMKEFREDMDFYYDYRLPDCPLVEQKPFEVQNRC